MDPPQEKVAYIHSRELLVNANRLPFVFDRASFVYDLLNSYKLLLDDKFLVVKSRGATDDDLRSFHSESYINFIKKCSELDTEDLKKLAAEHGEEYGLAYSCPILPELYSLVQVITGASITAAKLLVSGKFKTVINWFGGWHDAQRNRAEGFCYINDVVIAIKRLNRKFKRVLYVDLDIHHGSGVQNAFDDSNKVLTLSFHKVGLGIYPCSGRLEDVGYGEGQYYALNVPLKNGVSHQTYIKVFVDIFVRVLDAFRPSCIVVQCGADALSGDSGGDANLTLESFEVCVKKILECDLPTMFLGGGGYNLPNTARLWTFLTALIAGIHLNAEIPDTCKHFTEYSPGYELAIPPGMRKDENTPEYIDFVTNKIYEYCRFIHV